MTVNAPAYLFWLTRMMVIDIRGALTLEPGYMRWRPSGWYGRRAPRGAGFEIPLTELGSIDVVAHRFGRSDLIFEDLGGNEVKADGNRRVIRLRVRPRDADAALRYWSFVPVEDDRSGHVRWFPKLKPP
ncbi:MAG: hypothetical protein QOI95_3938 [Acidimicrobiaceae bacterium]|jgi:hypothetical protein